MTYGVNKKISSSFKRNLFISPSSARKFDSLSLVPLIPSARRKCIAPGTDGQWLYFVVLWAPHSGLATFLEQGTFLQYNIASTIM